MDDLISRKWLMECVEEGWIKFDTEKDTNTYIHLVRDIAPPAQRKGKWDCPMPRDGQTVWIYCPDCIYHDFVFEGAIFRGNRCRWNERRGR